MALTDEGGGMNTTMLVSPTGGYSYGGVGNGGWDNGNGWWIILLFILLASGNWGNNGFTNGGGFGGIPIVMNDGFANGSVQRGFDQAAVMGGISDVQNGVQGLATQLCNGFASNNAAIAGAQSAITQQIYADTIADLERSFAAQTANTAGLTAIQSQLAQCCCDNRLATNDLKYTIATENCADRAAIADGIRDLLAAQNAGTQRILDQICQDKIDAKNDTIAQLRQELLYARGQASQDVQTARILAGQTAEVDALYNRLDACPIGTTPVYGRQPIFTCGGNMGCGCGVA